ncbi:MAG: hypothetical protein MK006_18485 [Pirellulales bacterium]|nr:hypothetical protein [Pirellulales bacterium]
MGSKRIGLARMEALIENLKRELSLGASASLKLGASGYFVPVYPDAASESNTGAHAVSVACYHSRVTTGASGAALTLAAGTVAGQMKKIEMIADGGGDATLTIADPVDSSNNTIAFEHVGDQVELMWNGSAWRIIAMRGSTATANGPTIS